MLDLKCLRLFLLQGHDKLKFHPKPGLAARLSRTARKTLATMTLQYFAFGPEAAIPVFNLMKHSALEECMFLSCMRSGLIIPKPKPGKRRFPAARPLQLLCGMACVAVWSAVRRSPRRSVLVGAGCTCTISKNFTSLHLHVV